MTEKKDELIKIVGKANVLDNPKTLEAYSRDFSFAAARKPWFVVKPKNVDEVQGIVKWANDTSTPLVPVSSGPPHFRGDTVPSVPEAVIIDLSGMKRVININRRNRVAVIEPGVTYGQLQQELPKEGMRLSTSLLPGSNKSVITSLLEREPRLNPRYQWAYLDPLRSLEIVWGDSNKFWTGGAAGGPQDLEKQWAAEQWQLSGGGPAQVDFYKLASAAQGSMGIVTWASVKCELLPELHKLFFVPSEKLDDLLDLTYRILRFRYADELLLLNSSNLAYILGEGVDQIKALTGKLPPWLLVLGVAGRSILPRERVEFQEQDIREIAQGFGLQLLPSVPGAMGVDVLEKILNPSKEPYWKLGYKGGCQDIFFETTLNRTPEFVRVMYSVTESLRYSWPDIGIYIQPRHQGVSCHCEFSLPYNPDDQKEVTMMKELYTKASEALLKHGAFFSRPYGIWANMAFNRDVQTTIALKKVKKIFDPNNVMNPGKLCF